jgi:hypothetical protein
LVKPSHGIYFFLPMKSILITKVVSDQCTFELKEIKSFEENE